MATAELKERGEDFAPLMVRKGRRIRRALAASGLTLIVLSVTGAGASYFVSQPAVAAAMRDQASILAKRSPGARGLALFLTKHRPPVFPVREYGGPPLSPGPVSAFTETSEGTPELDFVGPQAVPESPDVPGSPPAAPLAEGTPFPTPPEGGGGLVIVGGPGFGGGPIIGGPIIGGPGIGGPVTGGVPGDVSPQIVEPTPTSGVPELSVWAMMIVGFFGAGSALRSRRAAERALADAARV